MNLRTNRCSSRRSKSKYIKKVREKNDKVAKVVNEEGEGKSIKE